MPGTWAKVAALVLGGLATVAAATGVVLAVPRPAAAAPRSRPALPAGWRVYADAARGFEVYAPPGDPRQQEVPPGKEIRGKLTAFMFADNQGLGQVMALDYVGAAKYDLEKGLDGAVTGAVKNLGGTMVRFRKKPFKTRPARQFEFSVERQGHTIRGFGLAVGSGPRSITAAMAFADLGRPGAEAKARAFVASFRLR